MEICTLRQEERRVNLMDPKLRIGVIGMEGPEAGGAHTAEAQMASRLGSLTGDCDLVFISSTKTGSIGKILGNRIKFLGQFFTLIMHNPAIWFIVRRTHLLPISRFERRIKKKKIDLLFFVGQYDLATKLRQTPYIVTIWDLGHRDLPELPEMHGNLEFDYREWRIKNLAIKAAYVIVDSEVTKSNLTSLYGIKAERVVSIPFVVEKKSSEQLEARESFAFYPAHFWSHKNHSILFYSIHHLIQHGKNPRELVLTGLDRGNKKFLDNLVNELKIQKYVKYLGFVSPIELEELYKKAGVTVMPSLLGPTNLPPLEALSFGCPIAVSENGDANLEKYDSIIVLDPFDLDEWSKVMSTEFIFDPVDRNCFNEIQAATEVENRAKLLQMIKNFKKIASTYK